MMGTSKNPDVHNEIDLMEDSNLQTLFKINRFHKMSAQCPCNFETMTTIQCTHMQSHQMLNKYKKHEDTNSAPNIQTYAVDLDR